MASTHSSKLERWLGTENVEKISQSMRGWYGSPIPIGNVPGRIFATSDGDFCGPIKGGQVSTMVEYASEKIRKACRKWAHNQRSTLNTGFASLSDLINEATTGGKRQSFMFSKTGATGVANTGNNLFDLGFNPATMATLADNTGESPTNATVGALPFTNPSGSDTLHFVTATSVATVANNVLLMYDLYYRFLHNIATDPQAVAGVPTRYQDTTSKNTFITVFVSTALGVGTPTYEVTYMDQDGNTPEAAPLGTLVGSAIARRFPFATTVGNGWFMPLNAGDSGVRKITNLNLSAASTGKVYVCLCKPYVIIPQPFANQALIIDGLNSAFNLVEITPSSCIQFMEINKGATTATTYIGQIILVSG